MSKQRIPRRHDIGLALGALALILNLAACGGGTESEADARIAEARSTIASARSTGRSAWMSASRSCRSWAHTPPAARASTSVAIPVLQ